MRTGEVEGRRGRRAVIIQIRGTSGSGKTWVMRQILDGAHWQAEYAPGRRRPLYYRSVEPGMDPTVILGSYETACGGCDSIGSARAVYKLTQQVLRDHPGVTVLQEGLLLSEDVKWTTELAADFSVLALFLTTPVETCLAQIRARRAAAGNAKPLNEHNTRARVGVIERARVKLLDRDVECRLRTSDQSIRVIRAKLTEGH